MVISQILVLCMSMAQLDLEREFSKMTENELYGKSKIEAFFGSSRIDNMLLKVTKHKLTTFQNIVNILNVSLNKKQLHMQEGKVSWKCPILLQFNEWKRSDFPLDEIEQNLNVAIKDIEKVFKMKITIFFQVAINKNSSSS